VRALKEIAGTPPALWVEPIVAELSALGKK
jgi:hypothetical protein